MAGQPWRYGIRLAQRLARKPNTWRQGYPFADRPMILREDADFHIMGCQRTRP